MVFDIIRIEIFRSECMKRIYLSIFICMLFGITGCTQKESVYSLSETEVTIEVNEKSFDPLDYLLKNGEALTDEEKKLVKTGAEIDTSELGSAIFKFPEHNLELTVHIVDDTAPEMSLLGFQVKKGVVFTWNEENIAKLKPHLKDNYDHGDLLKKSLQCDSVDTSKIGKQIVSCYIEDSSGNRTKETVEIEVIE